MEAQFLKMQASGNDYVIMNCLEQAVPEEKIISGFAREISNRYFGVGSRGLILVLPGERQKVRIRMFHSDGSEQDPCSNAIACVGRYIYDSGLVGEKKLSLESGDTDIHAEIIDSFNLRIDIEQPYDLSNTKTLKEHSAEEYNTAVIISDREFTLTPLFVHGPQAILFLQDFNVSLHSLAKKIERHSMFPGEIQVSFIRILSREDIQIRTWKKGEGELLSCANGACAGLVAAALNGFADREATLHTKGGDLFIEWNEKTNHLYMTGPAAYVFSGTYYFEEENT